MDFDSTLAFPGEGPVASVRLCLGLWIFVSFLSRVVCVAGGSLAVEPRNAEDVLRATRREAIKLDTGRPVQPLTKNNRDKLMTALESWCRRRGLDLARILSESSRNPDFLNKMLTEYGQDLFSSGIGRTAITAKQ